MTNYTTEDPGDRSGAERAARAAAKEVIRGLTTATARWRVTPDFIIIGAKRGGTTSLWRYLQAHPQIHPMVPAVERLKGTYYFDEGFGGLSPAWYRSHFPLALVQRLRTERNGAAVVGEASPYYLYHPLAPSRARAACPRALRVALVRDPVERAYSHWKERIKTGTEQLPFREALHAENSRIAGEHERLIGDSAAVSLHHRHHSYVDQGRYSVALRRWIDASEPGSVEVWFSEEFFLDPSSHLRRFADRLGLEPYGAVDSDVYNAVPSQGMDPDDRRWLESQLRDDAHELARLLDRQLPWAWV